MHGDQEWCSIFSFSIEQNICEFMMPSMKCSSPTPAALMQPHIRTNSRQAFLCLGFRRGFFRGRHPCMPFLCSVRRIVSWEIVTPVWLSTSLDNCRELACRFSSTLLIRRRSCRGVPWTTWTSLWDGCSSIFFKCLYHFCYSILTDK